MPTPFDPALRIQKRTLDAIRISLLAEASAEQALIDERMALDTTLHREAGIAATDWQLGAHPYGQRIRSQRSAVETERSAVDLRLQRLRDAAMNACGQLLAITDAAASFATSTKRAQAAADQSRIDDLVGARHVLRTAGRQQGW